MSVPLVVVQAGVAQTLSKVIPCSASLVIIGVLGISDE